MAKIYVGNLPFTASEADIRALFSQHGTVESVSLPTDRETGRPRGFGFVEMSQSDAARAIQNLNGNMVGPRLNVNAAAIRPSNSPKASISLIFDSSRIPADTIAKFMLALEEVTGVPLTMSPADNKGARRITLRAANEHSVDS